MDLNAHFKGARNLVFVQAGVPLFSEGEPGNTMYVLMEGSATIVVAGHVIEVVKPGDVIGEMALLDSSVRSATVFTRSNCRLLAMDSIQFDFLVRESPEFARHVMTVIAGRLRRMNQRLLEAVYSEPTIRDILRRKNSEAVENLGNLSRISAPSPRRSHT